MHHVYYFFNPHENLGDKNYDYFSPYTWGNMFIYFLAMRKYPAIIIPLQEEKKKKFYWLKGQLLTITFISTSGSKKWSFRRIQVKLGKEDLNV